MSNNNLTKNNWWISNESWSESNTIKDWNEQAKQTWDMLSTKEKVLYMAKNFCFTYHEAEAMYRTEFSLNTKTSSN